MSLRGLSLVLVASLFGCLVGCEDRFGAYITIDASTKEMAFDRLELYYGIEIGKTVPTSPKYAMPESVDTPQLVVARTFAPDDVQMFASRRDSYTVWIPDGGENDNLGAYVLAIAYAGDQQVGIGELFDFEVPADDIVYKYSIDLEAPAMDTLYEWGRGQTQCLRVQRARGNDLPAIVAIVDPDDSDCDRFPDRSNTNTTDCEPLRYCDGSGQGDCVGTTPCLHADDTCSIGACSNGDSLTVSCADETCVSDVLCEKCDLTGSPAEILDCALVENATHPSQDLAVPLRGNATLCSDPTILDISLPFACTNPTVDAVAYFMSSDPFEFTIEPGPVQNICRLKIYSTTPGEQFVGVPHLLVTVDVLPPRRTGFVVGLIGQGGACPTAGEPLVRPYEPNIGSCPIPEL